MATILVADDNADVRRPLVRLLKAEGYSVITAANSNEAMAHSQRHRLDLILLDVAMPPFDGLTFLSLLRDSPSGSDVPVIIVTAFSDSMTHKRAEDLGVKDYFVKSQFAPEELVEAVRKHVRPAPPKPT